MTACFCPKTYPDVHLKDLDLSNEAMHRIPLATFFFMPLSYHTYADKQQRAISDLELVERWPGLTLSHTGFLRGSLTRILEAADSPSRFVSNLPPDFKLQGFLHPGGIGTIKSSLRALQNHLFDQGRMPKELYLCYLTCPRCEEEKGGEKILLLRRFQESATLKNRLKNRQ